MPGSSLELEDHGAAVVRNRLPAGGLAELGGHADTILHGKSGIRLFGDRVIGNVLGRDGALGSLALECLGPAARPVRAILFDKTPENNWAVPWHRDRTIAVRARHEVDGYGPWSMKAGVPHVAPPYALLAGMLTLRLHLDDCGEDNAPLLIAPGSHRLELVPAGKAAATAVRSGIVSCPAEAGDVWLYATPILHASEPARRPRRRRVLHVDYAARDLPGDLEWLGIG